MIAMIGTSDRLCWLAETCKILLLLLLEIYRFVWYARLICDHRNSSLPRSFSAWTIGPFVLLPQALGTGINIRTDVADLVYTDLLNFPDHQKLPICCGGKLIWSLEALTV